VQVAPIKPTLKAPGSMQLKLRYDGPVSNCAFKISLRRYTECSLVHVDANPVDAAWGGDRPAFPTAPLRVHPIQFSGNSVADKLADIRKQLTAQVGRCRLTVSKPVLKAPLVSALETKM